VKSNNIGGQNNVFAPKIFIGSSALVASVGLTPGDRRRTKIT